MLRSRRDDELTPSPYQCKPRSLVYALEHAAALPLTLANHLPMRIRHLLPEPLHEGWNAIVARQC